MNAHGTGAPDSDLVRRLCFRDADAMGALYDRYGHSAYSLFLRATGDCAMAEDLTQELFIRLWNRVRQFDPARGSFKAWLLSAARNMAIDQARSSTARLERLVRPIEDVNGVSHSASPGAAPRIEESIRVKRALTSLPSHQRRLIELVYFDGYSQAEIAKLLDQPLGTVKSGIRSALLCLRAESKVVEPRAHHSRHVESDSTQKLSRPAPPSR